MGGEVRRASPESKTLKSEQSDKSIKTFQNEKNLSIWETFLIIGITWLIKKPLLNWNAPATTRHVYYNETHLLQWDALAKMRHTC